MIFIVIFVLIISGCGPKVEVPEKKKEAPPAVTRKVPPKPVTALLKKKVEIKYAYHGDNYRDPFVSLKGKESLILSEPEKPDEGQFPVLGSLSLKGIIKDKYTKMALISGPRGSYILKNGKLYDNRNRVVPGITGKIYTRSVTLTTADKFVRKLKLPEKKGELMK